VTLGYNARNDEIRDNITRMRREWEAHHSALATVRRFNATLSAKGYVGSGLRLPPRSPQNIIGWLSPATVAAPSLIWTCVLSRVTRKPLSVWRSVTCNALGATVMAGGASLRWRGIR